jgi:phosphoserine phosphatase
MNKRAINKVITAGATNMAKLQKKIAQQLGLDYSITNKSVIIDYRSNNIVKIIINGDFDNKQDFDLNLLK